jgi:hypothetical protein
VLAALFLAAFNGITAGGIATRRFDSGKRVDCGRFLRTMPCAIASTANRSDAQVESIG